MWSDIGTIFSAVWSQDSFEIRNALRSDAFWWIGVVVCLVGGYLVSLVYSNVKWIERHLERTIMVASYLAIAFIIFWGVIDRFVFSNQQPWSTTIPPILFMIMAWFGAAYNIRLRTHLSFSEFRTKMPRPAQMACLWLDCGLWFGFALILFVTTCRQTALSASNFAIVLGTDNVMLWWFLLTAPVAAILMAARAIENIRDDMHNWRTGAPLIKQAVIGGDA
ncbi:TRAP transporter small permease subunit [uncultured Tateyamaria sp.]|uniref:TRAP transporter small permease n=1 Tax=Tateyamaria sp. 1078 TaxID=3417464 RepID=UPI002638967D|nr:TRAP transporter small permease subunit [uncultured Tateyamaria sp.]